MQSNHTYAQNTKRTAIGTEELRRAATLLADYKRCKSSLENRIVEDERWYQLRHWDVLRRGTNGAEARPEPTSAWLFNSLMNKHADAMDNFPEPNILPREQGDEEDAKTLSAILPVLLEQNDFEETYSHNWWEKLKHGTGVYGVFWNKTRESGLGDVDIRAVDLLNLFWEPGVSDIQQSRNVFVLDLHDKDALEAEFPQLAGKQLAAPVEVRRYFCDEVVPAEDKVVVVDWYYKVRAANGRTLLHYVKFVGDTLLFASENDPAYAMRGWYDHGEYPFVFDTLFPEKGTPVGFGFVAVTKDPQLYIDKLNQNILENALQVTRKRYFVKDNGGVNEEEFRDLSNTFVHVAGSLDEDHIREIVSRPLDGIYVGLLQMKIDELKETSSNRDISSGGVSSGVTAAAAIAALQEAGNKVSRDMIGGSYRKYAKIDYLCIELVRQFYDEARSFRITGDAPGGYRFIQYSNRTLKGQAVADHPELFRRPVFDVKVRVQKKSPFSRMAQNELAKEMYAMGFFRPDKAQEALIALEAMDFEGKEKVVEQVRRGEDLLALCKRLSEWIDTLTAAGLGADPPPGYMPEQGASMAAPRGSARGMHEGQRAAMTRYGLDLAKRSTVDMGRQGGVMAE